MKKYFLKVWIPAFAGMTLLLMVSPVTMAKKKPVSHSMPPLSAEEKILQLSLSYKSLDNKQRETLMGELDKTHLSKQLSAYFDKLKTNIKIFENKPNVTSNLDSLKEIFLTRYDYASFEAEKILTQQYASKLTAQDYLTRARLLSRYDLLIAAAQNMERAYALDNSIQIELAELQFQARNYKRASVLFAGLKEAGTPHLELNQKLAQSYARSDQFDKAIAVYESIYNETPSEQVLQKIAFLYFDKGDYAASLQRYQQLVSNYPNSGYAKLAAWASFWGNYRLGHYPEALQSLDHLISSYPNHPRANSFEYWRARILEKTGSKNAAKQYYQQLASSSDFYGWLAQQRLQHGNLADAKIATVSSIGWGQRINAVALLKSEVPETLQEMIFTGRWEEYINCRGGVSPPKDCGRGNPAPTDDSDGYPAAFSVWVKLFSQARRIPTSLIWAIMREESRFRPEVRSPANAIGLMQLIPQTAYEVAEALGRKQFMTQDLTQPAVNIEMGSQYLAMMLRRFDGNLIHTIASYNAGPDAVTRWLASRNNLEWDEFVEEIPYLETRAYVKKVWMSYVRYAALYP